MRGPPAHRPRPQRSALLPTAAPRLPLPSPARPSHRTKPVARRLPHRQGHLLPAPLGEWPLTLGVDLRFTWELRRMPLP